MGIAHRVPAHGACVRVCLHTCTWKRAGSAWKRSCDQPGKGLWSAWKRAGSAWNRVWSAWTGALSWERAGCALGWKSWVARPQWPWPAGGLGLKLLSTYKMVLVSLCHGNCDRGTWLGMVLRFWDATYSSREHCLHFTLHLLGCGGRIGSCNCLCFQAEASISEWLATLFISQNVVCPHTVYGGW